MDGINRDSIERNNSKRNSIEIESEEAENKEINNSKRNSIEIESEEAENKDIDSGETNTDSNETKTEYYTIDAIKSAQSTTIIYGGNTHEIFINDIANNRTLEIFNDFSDSVVYLKFISMTTFYGVSLNGEVALYDIEQGLIEMIELEDEITSHSYYRINSTKHILILGSITGNVYYFFDNLKYKCFYGHTSEIFQAEYLDEKIFSISSERFIVFDLSTEKKEYTQESYLLSNFFLVSSSVFLIGSEKNLRIYKHDRLLKRIDGLFSSYVRTPSGGIICGGESLIEVAFNEEISVFDYQKNNNCGNKKPNILDMKIIGNQLFVSDGKILGKGDIREGRITWFEFDIGEIFDFIPLIMPHYLPTCESAISVCEKTSENKVCLVGERGLTVIEL
ncbi:hypothetical protein CDIK_1961 [Cucumispora dikerogammari]|nr:hypothetical protein CDIK_1961 [Cucumispora dikerogammari]